MPKPLTASQLDHAMCETPGCDHTAHDGLIFHARCHERAGVEAMYKDGIMHFTCKVCKRTVCDVKVAEI